MARHSPVLPRHAQALRPPDVSGRKALDIVDDRLVEIVRRERRLPESVAEQMLELDRRQREGANGYPEDENIAGLVELLRGQAA
jgi:hypothetical protein